MPLSPCRRCSAGTAGEAAGRWKLLPIRANGSPGFAFYLRDGASGSYLPFALNSVKFFL